MHRTKHLQALTIVLLSGLALSACVSNPLKNDDSDSNAKTTKEAANQAQASKSADGDSSEVKDGRGQRVKGIKGWEGEIIGKPFPGAEFKKLKIGMPMKQVTDLIGQPSDQGAYVTGKAWIPFYFGSDRHRYETVYKNQGRLVFAGGGIGDYTSGHLIRIMYNHDEPAYR